MNENLKYRSEVFYGEGYRDAAAVMAHEVFELQNTDILSTLHHTILKGTPIGTKLEILEEEINNDCVADGDEDGELYTLLEEAYEDEDLGIEFFKEVLAEINSKLWKDIKYCLWLCDTKEDVYEYDLDGNLTDDDIDVYEASDVILSDLGSGGKLYGYETLPKVIGIGSDYM